MKTRSHLYAVLLGVALLGSFGALVWAQGTSNSGAVPGDPAATPPLHDDTVVMKQDKNKDGVISRSEANGELRKVWDQWDRNADGVLDASEYAIGASTQEAGKAR